MSRLRQKEIGDFLDCLRDVYRIRDINSVCRKQLSLKLGRWSSILTVPYFQRVDLRTQRNEFITDLQEAYQLPLKEIIASLPADHQLPYLPHYLQMHRRCERTQFQTL